MTRKQFYLDLGEFIFETINPAIDGEVKHFDLWNEQTGEDWSKLFQVPAVFLEFNPIAWTTVGDKVQRAQITFNLHIVSEVNSQTAFKSNSDIRDKNLGHLDLLDELHFHLSRFRKEYFSTLSRVNSLHDHYHDKLTKHIETYACTFETTSAQRKLAKKEGDLLSTKVEVD